MVDQGLSEATVCKRCGNAKVFFGVAVKRKLITDNPFTELESGSVANKSRQYFLKPEDAQKVLDACPDAEWRLIFALCRYGGLRCPSEVLGLRWVDVKWDDGRIHITSPKTERYEGRGSRDIPMFPELRTALMDVFDQAQEGAEFCINRYRCANSNLRTQFERIIRRAGLQAWPRIFQNLRATRESELAAIYPLHVVTAWIGNTARIAERHYLQVPPEFFQQASEISADSESAAQNPAQYTAVQGSKGQKGTRDKDPENALLQGGTGAYNPLRKHLMETGGIEPPFARCDRAVIPLHHVPDSLPRSPLYAHADR